MKDELLDLVNDKDEVIGTIWRSESERLEAENLGYIRAVELFLVNDEGKIWVPKRTAHKKIAPNGLDYSMGGHVDSGETYEQAALREAQEELNMTIRPTELEHVHSFAPGAIPYFRRLYLYRTNETPEYNPDDYVEAQWMTPRQLADLLSQGVPAKQSLLESVDVVTERASGL